MKSFASTSRGIILTMALSLAVTHPAKQHQVSAFVPQSTSGSTLSAAHPHSQQHNNNNNNNNNNMFPASRRSNSINLMTARTVLKKSLSSITRLYNQPLATEGDWSAYLDSSKTGFIYYFNAVTGESLWEKPTDTFPDVTLEGSIRQQAQKKQEEYLKQIEDSNSAQPTKKKGFFQAIFETPAEPVQQQQQQTAVVDDKSGGWFSGGSTSSTATKEKKKEEDNWFGSVFAETTADSTATKDKSVAGEKQKKPTLEKAGKGIFGEVFKSVVDTAAANGARAAKVAEKLEIATTEAPIQVQSAAYVLPHPAKVRWGGEDAVFTKGRTFGVFDGVSGAEKLDGVPLYSKTLAEEMKRRIANDDESLNMQDLTRRLAQCADTADETATGASTAVVACIGADGFLRALNVGDSACIVIRNRRIVARTREISHYFECPYQLSVDSPDRPWDGTKLNVELQRGDLVLMASDGIFDNLKDEEIVEIVSKEKNLTTMAKRVSEYSRKVSLDGAAETPYAKLAKRFGDPDYADGLGGKVDDVSCIVVSYQ